MAKMQNKSKCIAESVCLQQKELDRVEIASENWLIARTSSVWWSLEMGMAKSREWNFLGTNADLVTRVVIAKQV